MRKYKSRCRENLIEQANSNSLMALLKATDMSLEAKQELVKERNKFLFIFGEKLLPQGNDDYATYINKLYLGE
jgi:hypothetical protein